VVQLGGSFAYGLNPLPEALQRLVLPVTYRHTLHGLLEGAHVTFETTAPDY
jgi:hypothetical protein